VHAGGLAVEHVEPERRHHTLPLGGVGGAVESDQVLLDEVRNE
jgi:hypothetical protein